MAKAKTKAAVTRKAAKTPARAAKAPKKLMKASVAKPVTPKAAIEKASRKPVIVAPAAPRSAEPLTLPAAKTAAVAAAKPQPIVRKVVEIGSPRADLPPPDGFTLLVDGHFKNCFDDLKGAKAAASKLKNRFPMLKLEIYDAAKKARLPA